MGRGMTVVVEEAGATEDIVGFCMAFFNCASEMGAILDLVISIAAIHAEVISFAACSFLRG